MLLTFTFSAFRLLLQDYRARKRTRLQKRIEEQLRAAAQSCSDVQNASRSGPDLVDLLHSFGGGTVGDKLLTKGTRFTHTEKFTFTQVGLPCGSSAGLSCFKQNWRSQHNKSLDMIYYEVLQNCLF